jgi:hypothetical protein
LIGQVIYVQGASTHTIYAISPNDGRVIGKLQLEKAPQWLSQPRFLYVSGLLNSEKYLLITTSNTVYAYSKDG